MDFLTRAIIANIPNLLAGIRVTTEICLISFAVAAAAGFVVCLLRLYGGPLRWLARLWIDFGRNTPIFVQLMWVSYAWIDLIGWPKDFFTAAWIALALQSSGYLAETFRAGIEGVDRGQVEAARSLGMGGVTAFRRIVLPQALLAMAPSFVNQFVVVVKCSTLVSVVTVPDLMYQALRLASIWNDPVEILSLVALLYIVFILAIASGLKRACDRLRASFA
ncbi:MAG TPA: amino acid ABC transporter permease [Alphaproteobacteria bacterium]